MTVARFALVVDAGDVIRLVSRDTLRSEAASVEGVEERGDVQGVVAAGCLDTPGERQAGLGADSGMDFEPEERTRCAGRDSGSM